MAIYTPRGLKIRIEIPYAFALMQRLYPEITPFRVLKTTEGIEELPSLLSLLAGLVSFALRLSPYEIVLSVMAAQIAGTLINIFGFYVFPGLIALSTAYSYVSGFGVLLVIIFIVGYFLTGLYGVLAFFVGTFSARIVAFVLHYFQTKKYMEQVNFPLTASEVHFFNAYRLHAVRVGVTTDIDLPDCELKESNWEHLYTIFSLQWPDIANRFTAD